MYYFAHSRCLLPAAPRIVREYVATWAAEGHS
jgi:hypothetical protein